ncbi:MAG: GNAT family N-acetyltransferase [Anaerolineae bacterium]|nr:GNAT family N-acetyltransferase [Anaerolineae bacterium]
MEVHIMPLVSLLLGPRLRLSAFTSSDAATVARWGEDSEYARLLSAEPAYPKTEHQWSEWIREGQSGKNNYLFAARLLSTDALIGFVELGDILWTHRTAWLAVGIGEKVYQDQGYGGEAVALALDFAFQELNLHRVQLTVFSYNSRAIALYKKLGFTHEGTYRQALLRQGERYDMLLYGILAQEWLRPIDR